MLKIFLFFIFQVFITKSTSEQNNSASSFENEVLNLIQEIRKIEKEINYSEEKINEFSWIRIMNSKNDQTNRIIKPTSSKFVSNRKFFFIIIISF